MTAFEEDLAAIATEIHQLGFQNKSVLVTGATGLVGSVLVKAMLTCNQMFQENIMVVALVRNSSKAATVFGHFAEDAHLQLIQGDVLQPIAYAGDVDFIIHAASETKSVNMVQYPVETLWTSVCGSKHILDFAKDKEAEGVVYLSSMEAFGQTDPCLERVAEKDLGYIDISNVRSCYPESKRMVENMCACYASEYHVPVMAVRLAQTFGAGVSKSEGRVFAQFAKSAMQGNDIVLHTKGESYGNYVYTADAARAIFILLKKGIPGEVYTVANESTAMKIREMAELVAQKLAHGNIQVVFDIPEENKFGYAPDVQLRLDASKMRALGWSPRTGLLEAYERLIHDWGTSET